MNWPLDCVRAREPLSKHTTLRIGGPAEWFAEPHTVEELCALLRGAQWMGLSVSMLGGGTNLLVPDRGVQGLTVRLGRGFRAVEVLTPPDAGETLVRCGAGVSTQRLVALACERGWAGLEAMAGLPGQVGGAIAGNAQNIGRFVEEVTVVGPDGSVAQTPKSRLAFGYRDASLPAGIIVEAILKFSKTSRELSTEKVQQQLCYRNATQDLHLPSAGCAFKNPPGLSAGKLIDQAGLKGARIGDAQVSLRHANFIVNHGLASSDDVLSLMEHIQRRVSNIFGVVLTPEIRMFGEKL